ncbi:MAG: hypothetical protein A2Y53_02630 [Chloroflexi bacterium RBG_16_47_49]|nr:MAG: hypothetical protein A2Y53_02630 [Chloroflexi bacterium RBG_16_47_49]
MNLNSNAIFNRVEIIFYATLTACMSGVNRIRVYIDHLVKVPDQILLDEQVNSVPITDVEPEKNQITPWTYISQALLPLVIWIVLGFAAGFLIGMLRPR